LNRPLAVVDASVAIKWIFPEEHSEHAWALRRRYSLIAPQLIYAECANIVWKKLRRQELTREEASGAGSFVDEFTIEVAALHELVPLAIDLSLRLDHPAYDCFYLALAAIQQCPLVTADGRLHRKVHATLPHEYAERCVMLEAFTPPTADHTR
jgi:predicted nucleic acid-binding protein